MYSEVEAKYNINTGNIVYYTYTSIHASKKAKTAQNPLLFSLRISISQAENQVLYDSNNIR